MGSAPQGGSLLIRAERRNRVVRLFLSGVLDAASCPELRAAVSRLASDSVSAIVLDLRDVAICDACAADAILAAYEGFEKTGRGLFLLNADHSIQREGWHPRASLLLDKDHAFRGLALSIDGAGTWQPVSLNGALAHG